MDHLRIIHTADIHLGMENFGKIDPATGLSSRITDFLDCFDRIVDYTIAQQADLFLFAGDAFRDSAPNPTLVREFANRVMRLADAGIPCYLLSGNHDIPRAPGKATAIEAFSTFRAPRVVVADRFGVQRIPTPTGDLQVVGLPWVVPERVLAQEAARGLTDEAVGERVIASIQNRMANLRAQLDPTIPTVLTGHATITGATLSTERDLLLGRDWVLPTSLATLVPADYIALGHIHKHQILTQNPPMIYSGSISRVNFGEEREEKGFVEVLVPRRPGTGTTWTFHPLPARPFRTVEIDLRADDPEFPMGVILARLEEEPITDAVVRLFIRVRPGKEKLVQEAAIKRALARAHSVATIRCEAEDAALPRQVVDANGRTLGELSPAEALDLFLRARRVDTQRRSQLLALAREVAPHLIGAAPRTEANPAEPRDAQDLSNAAVIARAPVEVIPQ